jgi:pilus assembly protein CpaF
MNTRAETVRDRLVASGEPVTPASVAAALRADGGVLGDTELLALARRLAADLSGAGPLEELMTSGVTDILVNGPDEVWVDDGDGLHRADVRFGSEDEVRRLAQRLAAQAGRRLDAAVPYVDARLPGGARLHAVLPPVAPEGACVSLRMPPRRVFGLEELVARGTLGPHGAALLRALVAARAPFLVSGGTGAGKTTVLSSLLSLVDGRERIVLAEDSPELRPEHPHVVRLQARPANIEGSGEVSLEVLVRQALRMRPDRLVVGEARGPEIVPLLGALNTGHGGGAGTLHANSAEDVPARVEALGCAAGLDRAAVHSQLAATRALVVHLVRDAHGRRLAELRVLRRDRSGLVHAVPAVAFTPDGTCQEFPAVADLDARLGTSWREPDGPDPVASPPPTADRPSLRQGPDAETVLPPPTQGEASAPRHQHATSPARGTSPGAVPPNRDRSTASPGGRLNTVGHSRSPSSPAHGLVGSGQNTSTQVAVRDRNHGLVGSRRTASTRVAVREANRWRLPGDRMPRAAHAVHERTSHSEAESAFLRAVPGRAGRPTADSRITEPVSRELLGRSRAPHPRPVGPKTDRARNPAPLKQKTASPIEEMGSGPGPEPERAVNPTGRGRDSTTPSDDDTERGRPEEASSFDAADRGTPGQRIGGGTRGG